MKIEIFSAPNCSRCGKARILVEELIAELSSGLTYRMVNVVEDLDYAVALGVLATPAIAVDGKLIFTGLPSKNELRESLLRCIDSGNNDDA